MPKEDEIFPSWDDYLKGNKPEREIEDPITGLRTRELFYPTGIKRTDQYYKGGYRRTFWDFDSLNEDQRFGLGLVTARYKLDPHLRLTNIEKYPLPREEVYRLVEQSIWLDNPQPDFMKIDWRLRLSPQNFLVGMFANAQFDAEGKLTHLMLQAEPPNAIREKYDDIVSEEEFVSNEGERLDFIMKYKNLLISTVFDPFRDNRKYGFSFNNYEATTGGFRSTVKRNFENDFQHPDVLKSLELAERSILHLTNYLPLDERGEFGKAAEIEHIREQYASMILSGLNGLEFKDIENANPDETLHKLMFFGFAGLMLQNSLHEKTPFSYVLGNDFTERGFVISEMEQEAEAMGLFHKPPERGNLINEQQINFRETYNIQDKTFDLSLTEQNKFEVKVSGWRGRKPIWSLQIPMVIDQDRIRRIYSARYEDFRSVRDALGTNFTRF